MNKFAFVILSLVSILAFADLKNGDQLKWSFTDAPIISFEGVKANIQYEPESATSIAKYEGTVEVSVTVEGNLCGADPKSVGTILNPSESDPSISYINFIYPMEAGPMEAIVLPCDK